MIVYIAKTDVTETVDDIQYCQYDAITHFYRLQDIIVKKVQSFPTEIGLMGIEVFNIKSLKIGISINGLKKRYRHFLKKIFYSQILDEKDAIILENRIYRQIHTAIDSL